MAAARYQRVDWRTLDERSSVDEAAATSLRIRWFVPPLAVVLSVGQSILWISASNLRGTPLAGSLIPVLGFALLVATLLLINPVMRLLRRLGGPRPLGRAELMTLFAAMLVTSGVSTFGLIEQLVPLIATPYDPAWNLPQRGWSEQLLPALNDALYITDPQVIAAYREGVTQSLPANATWGEWFAFHVDVARQVPWGVWLWPLGYWMIFVAAAYGIYYSLTYVVLPFWDQREKLIFPLAKLPEALLPADDANAGGLPAILRSQAFWIAFLLPFLVFTYNGWVLTEGIPGLAPIPLGMSHWTVSSLVHGHAIFGGLAWSIGFLFLFVATGLAFLLPLEMSFSVWFYYLLSRVLLLVAVWSGFGANARDFPSDFLWNSNFISAQGGGGLFMFAGICLVRCLLEYRRLARTRKSWRERLWIALPVVGLFVSMAVLTLWLRWNNLSLLWSIVFVFVMTLLTLGLMRIVAEGGIYWFQAHTGFFHIFRMTGLGHVLPPAMLAPILPIYTVFFLDLKCFLAPNLLNAGKLHRDVGGSRWRFHLTVIASLVSSVVVSALFAIFLAYRRGADRMHYWFYGRMPQMVFDTARDTMTQAPRFQPGLTLWFVFGAGWVALSFFIRRTVFWFPHPLGYIMLVNPLMDQLWFAFIIAWLIKKPVLKYGGKDTYDIARRAAIGLIAGELIAIAIWTGVALWSGVPLHAHNVNRYGA